MTVGQGRLTLATFRTWGFVLTPSIDHRITRQDHTKAVLALTTHPNYAEGFSQSIRLALASGATLHSHGMALVIFPLSTEHSYRCKPQ